MRRKTLRYCGVISNAIDMISQTTACYAQIYYHSISKMLCLVLGAEPRADQ